jgi:hypothetical protein
MQEENQAAAANPLDSNRKPADVVSNMQGPKQTKSRG